MLYIIISFSLPPPPPSPSLQGNVTVDKFYASTAYCPLPGISWDALLTTNSKVPTSLICGAAVGVTRVDIIGLSSNQLSAPPVVGSAYLYMTYNTRIYIVLQIFCSYMLNTMSKTGDSLVKISLGATFLTDPQYVDVFYSSGLYSCYSLSIDLANVCPTGSRFVLTQGKPLVTTCIWNQPGPLFGTSVPGGNLFNPGSRLVLGVDVHLAAYSNSINSSSCNFGNSSYDSYSLRGGLMPFTVPSCVAPPLPPQPPPSLPGPPPLNPSSPPPPLPLPPRPSPPHPPTPPFPPAQPATLTIRTPTLLTLATACGIINNTLLPLLAASFLQCPPMGTVCTATNVTFSSIVTTTFQFSTGICVASELICMTLLQHWAQHNMLTYLGIAFLSVMCDICVLELCTCWCVKCAEAMLA